MPFIKTTIKTIKDLKEVIKDLPDDMDVMGYRGGNGDLYRIGYWVVAEGDGDEDTPSMLEEYPQGVLTIAVD